jgi:hypothetical protein
MLEKLKEKEANAEKCESVQNLVMKHCLSRQLFFNCPVKTTSAKCSEYEEFGKNCPMFPYVGGPHGSGKRGGKAGKNKNDADATKKESKEGADDDE